MSLIGVSRDRCRDGCALTRRDGGHGALEPRHTAEHLRRDPDARLEPPCQLAFGETRGPRRLVDRPAVGKESERSADAKVDRSAAASDASREELIDGGGGSEGFGRRALEHAEQSVLELGR